MKHCIVNFSDNGFKIGQDRLVKSLVDNKYQGDILIYNNFDEVGSKSHKQVPYQFKVFAIKKAIDLGYDIILYCDASLYAITDVMPIIYHIINKGYLMEYCGFSAGEWSTDICLQDFGISRDEAMNIPLHSAGFTGLNMRNEKTIKFFSEWYQKAKEEKTFIGDWNNSQKQCSTDERCLGHRHDQTTASIIADKYGLERTNPLFMQYVFGNTEIKQETIFCCQGIL